MIAIGESVEIRSLRTLLENYRGIVMYSSSHTVPLGQHMLRTYKKLIEDIKDIYNIEIVKISPRKWQVAVVLTYENSYNVEDDELFLSPANFNLKVLTEQSEIYQYYTLFGVKRVQVSTWELQRFPDMFKVRDENGKEYTQEDLRKMYNQQLNRR